MGLMVCRGTSIMLVCPTDGLEEIANPFLQASPLPVPPRAQAAPSQPACGVAWLARSFTTAPPLAVFRRRRVRRRDNDRTSSAAIAALL